MQFTNDELKSILESHIKWLNNDLEGSRADLRRADLRGADLRRADLRGADLRAAYLYEADLCEANLRGGDLREADLIGAVLRGAVLIGANLRAVYLCEADLRRADLRGADLRGADLCAAVLIGDDLREAVLRGAVLRGAVLRAADLREADLREADLREADLREAVLIGADLRGADLRGADLRAAYLCGVKYGSEINDIIPLACPEDGSFIAWKKAFSSEIGRNVLIKLQIPEDAKRSSATGRKCRASKALVLDIFALDNADKKVQCACSKFDSTFKYEVGKTVEVKDFDENRFNECAPGIHFFITKREAISY